MPCQEVLSRSIYIKLCSCFCSYSEQLSMVTVECLQEDNFVIIKVATDLHQQLIICVELLGILIMCRTSSPADAPSLTALSLNLHCCFLSQLLQAKLELSQTQASWKQTKKRMVVVTNSQATPSCPTYTQTMQVCSQINLVYACVKYNFLRHE